MNEKRPVARGTVCPKCCGPSSLGCNAWWVGDIRSGRSRELARCLMNAPDFDDDELEELDGLDQFETLDLEGTQISDAGLEHLE